MKLIYLAHTYGGSAHNYFKACKLETKLIDEHPTAHIFNAVKYFNYFKNTLEEKDILKMCLDMVSRCNELWVAPGWEDSQGCKAEIEEATLNCMKIRYLTEGTVLE